MTYEYWCQLKVPRKSWFTGLERAQAKRERKAAKRRRDAELTRLGIERAAAARRGEVVP